MLHLAFELPWDVFEESWFLSKILISIFGKRCSQNLSNLRKIERSVLFLLYHKGRIWIYIPIWGSMNFWFQRNHDLSVTVNFKKKIILYVPRFDFYGRPKCPSFKKKWPQRRYRAERNLEIFSGIFPAPCVLRQCAVVFA